MSEVKNIKGIDDETWAHFKSLAALNNMKAASMFKVLVNEYEKKRSAVWDRILNHKSKLTKEEIDKMEEAALDMRKHSGWRT